MAERGHFSLVGTIVKDEKYFDVSLGEVLRQHASIRKFEVGSTHLTKDLESDEEIEVSLVLKVSGHFLYRQSWDVALLMHNVRIDGFGFEERYSDLKGEDCSGWHRHVWVPRFQNARGKTPVECFESATNYQHFVTTALREMNIRLSGRDYGSTDLFDN